MTPVQRWLSQKRISRAFDVDFYLQRNPDVAAAGVDPLTHFLETGWREGRDPTPYFSTTHYLNTYPEVQEAGENPFVHFILEGRRRGLKPNPGGASEGLVRFVPAALIRGVCSLQHSLNKIRVSRAFDPAFYLKQNPDVAAAGVDPLEHFLNTGWKEGRDPTPAFSTRYYLNTYPEVRATGVNPFVHFVLEGRRKGMQPDAAAGEAQSTFLNEPASPVPIFTGEPLRKKPARVIAFYLPQFHAIPENDKWWGEGFTEWANVKKATPQFEGHYQPHVPGELGYYNLLTPGVQRRQIELAKLYGIEAFCFYLYWFAGKRLLEKPLDNWLFDWRDFKKRSEAYGEVPYRLYRGLCTSWDNTARRKKQGTLYANSSPALFREWLNNAITSTVKVISEPSERLIFVNAWNEWAEGAHLEPDERHGYAWLQSVRDALENPAHAPQEKRVLIVAHDAHPHGAQYLSLHLAETLVALGFAVDMIVLGDGVLLPRYRQFARVHQLRPTDAFTDDTRQLLMTIKAAGSQLALVNTTVSGIMVPALRSCGYDILSLVHELPDILRTYSLEREAAAICEGSDKVVFAAPQIKAGFESFAGRSLQDAVIRPQGLYHHSGAFRPSRAECRELIRERHGLDRDCSIILSVGFGDLRKGVDLFVDTCMSVFKTIPNAAAIWVGHIDRDLERGIRDRISAAKLDHRFVFAGFVDKPLDYYAASDVYALTSREDPFPSVVLEALDAEVPVVAFQGAGGIGELLERNCGIMVPFGDTRAMGTALCRILQSPDLASELGRTGSRIVADEFGFRDYVWSLLELGGHALPRVSVVVPNYNYGRYLHERLDSIERQTVQPYEIIILDDASTDDSRQVIARFARNCRIPVRTVFNERNSRNVFHQWLKGVELCRSGLVWIAEADDLCDPAFLETVTAPFQSRDVVLSYCESRQIDETGAIMAPDYLAYVADIDPARWKTSFVGSGLDEISTALYLKNTIPNASAVVFRRDVLLRVLRSHRSEILSHRFAGDWVCYLRVLERGAIAFSSQPLNSHRRHASSVTLANFNLLHLQEIMRVQRSVLAEFDLGSGAEAAANAYVQKLYEQFGLASRRWPRFSDHPDLCSQPCASDSHEPGLRIVSASEGSR